MAPEFFTFDEVLKELQIEKEELERMIEEGEVKAYREGDKIKFNKNDIMIVKATKMDQPTIAVPQDSEGDEVMFIEDLGDEDDLIAEETSGSFLDISNDQSAQPLLDISAPEPEDSSELVFDAERSDDELVFEQESGEDLLETGELLFDSKDKILPRDKEIEELFPDSEVGISPFDSREEKAIEDAWDLAEDMEEDIITTSSGSPEQLAIEESKRREKMKTVGSIVAGILAFAVIAVFALMPPQTAKSQAVLKSEQITEVKAIFITKEHYQEALVQPEIEQLDIMAPEKGVIEIVVAEGKIEPGQVLAKIHSSNQNSAAEIEQWQNRLKEVNTSHNAANQGNKKILADYNNYKKKRTSKNRINYGKTTDAQYKKMVGYYKKLKIRHPQHSTMIAELNKVISARSKAHKDFKANSKKDKKTKSKYWRKYLTAYMRYYQTKKEQCLILEKHLAQTKIDIEQKIANNSTKMNSPKEVKIDKEGELKWRLADREQIKKGQKLAEVLAFTRIKAHFRAIPDTEVVKKNNWQERGSVVMDCDGKKVTGIIREKRKNKSHTPTFDLIVELTTKNIKSGAIVKIHYPRQVSKFGVPAQAIIKDGDDSYIMIVNDDKLEKRKVETGELGKDGNIMVTGVKKGERVIATLAEMSNLKNGQKVKIKE